jgi:hypothetical protein
VYDRELEGRTLSFGVSGKLYRNSLVMVDRQTGSLWSHVFGASIAGPLRGERLEMLPSSFTSWDGWRREHPGTLMLDPSNAPYGADSYEGYYAGAATGILGVRRLDNRLPPKELVLGVLAPAAKAYALRDIQRQGRIRDRLGRHDVEIVYDPDSDTAKAFRLTGGGREQLPATPMFWFAWVDLFPGAPLWGATA